MNAQARARTRGQASTTAGQRWQRRYDSVPGPGRRLHHAVRARDVDPVYGPPDGAVVPDFERIGWPGEYPFTRGLYPTGYRGRTWTIRQFSGFGNAVADQRAVQDAAARAAAAGCRSRSTCRR